MEVEETRKVRREPEGDKVWLVSIRKVEYQFLSHAWEHKEHCLGRRGSLEGRRDGEGSGVETNTVKWCVCV